MTSFDGSVVGRRCDGPGFEVSADRIKAYAAATNDSTPVSVAGTIAPPVFAIVPLRPLIRAMLLDTTPLYGQLRGLHGEQDILVFAPIKSGMILRPHGSVIGIMQRATGTAVIVQARTEDQHGALINEQFITIYFPGATAARSVGTDAPEHRLPETVLGRHPDAVVAQQTDADQPARYAAASGDTGAYHLDEEAARAVGLPGVIMHGMCTMAFACRALIEHAGDDSTRLRRLAVRFARPVRPGERLTTLIWRLDGQGGSGIYGFETRTESGAPVLTHGRAEVA
ncbi:MAG TPA: MaoC/PaaZ C-terminal domain-containing protein [bacterium]|nr:MaoC/PaaZ C-terminal domain-containing protein [bacterium]